MNPYIKPVVVDIGASNGFSSSAIDMCLCLTRTRAGNFGYWSSTKGGRLDTFDMMRLQGFEASDIDWQGAGVKPSAFATALGNAQSLNVLTALVHM